MDKNTIIGFILIGLVLFAFSWLNRPSPEQIAAQEAQRRYQDSIARVDAAKQVELATAETTLSSDNSFVEIPDSVKEQHLAQHYGAFAGAVEGIEEFTTLENEKIEVRISNKGGRLCFARLKEYVTYEEQPLVLFDTDESDFGLTMVTATNRIVNTSDLYFTPIKGADPNSITMRLPIDGGSYMDFKYTLTADDYMLNFSIQGVGLNGILSPNTNSLDISWQQTMRQLEKGRKDENEYTGLYYKFVADDVENLNQGKDDEEQVSNRLKWISYKNKFFSTVLITDNAFTATRLQSKFLANGAHLKELNATTSVAFDLTKDEAIGFRYYIGPNKYKLLNSYDKGLSSD